MNFLLPYKIPAGQEKLLEEYLQSRSAPRKNLIKLVRHINIFNPKPDWNCWEYIYFDRQLTDEMIDLALKLKVRKPYYISDIAKIANMNIEDCAKLCDDICHVGIFEYTSDDHGVDMILMPVFAPGSMESAGLTNEQTEKYPEMAVAFPNYILDLQKKITTLVPMGNALMRAIPVMDSIKNEPKKAKFEEVAYWVERSGDSLAVAPCQCRRFRRMAGEGTADLEGEWCIEIGKYAESCIRLGKARRITKEECYEILRKAEEHGYVHQLSNIDGPDHSVFICNCSWDTCMALKTSWYNGTPKLSASNYVATVNEEECVACGGCMEVCPQNAVTLGQKLPQKYPVEIKAAITPHDHKWSRSYWQDDFLTNRKNVVPETGTSPCKVECPAHIAVQGYLKLAAQGDYAKALELIKKENPFPAVCGRVCARFCESACTRGDVDEPIAIDEVKKYIAQKDLNAKTRFVPKKKYATGKKIAVIGSGPAGLSCAYYLAVYGHSVTVFEKEEKLGGMLTYGIPSFRLEKDVIDAEIDILRELGVEFKTGVNVGADVTIPDLRAQGYKGFYVAIGLQGGRKLGVKGEDAKGVVSGVDFLKQVADGKDAAKLSGDVVVVGGGNVAIDVARTAIRAGAKTCTLLCLESAQEMPAADDEVEEAKAEGIKIINGYGPKSIKSAGGKVTGIEFKKCVSVFGEGKKFAPVYDENDTLDLKANYVIAAIGQSAVWGDLLFNTDVEFNRNGTAKAHNFTYQTKEPDIFVGGDIYTGARFAIDAIAAGHEGAESLHRYVWEGHSLILARDRKRYSAIDKENLSIGEYDTAKRQKPDIDKKKVKTFADERKIFTDDQVKIETARCLKCGAAHVEENICIGCGLCTTRCKFDAIKLTKVREAWGVPYEQIPLAAIKEGGARIGRITKRVLEERKGK